jgi:outer membrane protein assembly factor BamA
VRYPQAARIAFLCFLLVTVAARGQSHGANKPLPPSTFRLIAVNVSGSERYKPEDVVRAAGLELGRTVHEGDFKDAVRVLGDTGAFASVAYRFEYSPEGTKLDLEVQDAQRWVPARFDNLVWFSDQELGEKLHARVPLFSGQLPVTGQLPDDVSEALQELVDEKKIPGRVEFTPIAPGDGPPEAFVYSVTGPRITIGKVEFPNATPAELPRLEAAGRKLQGAEYTRSAFLIQEDKSLLPIYLEQGFLKAKFGDFQARVIQNDPNQVQVDITVPVVPGDQYKLSSLDFLGYKAFPADTLRSLVHLQTGQPANVGELRQDLEGIKELYETHGYMDIRIDSVPEINEPDLSVRYVLTFKEGAVYKMGDLEILGVDSHTSSRLQNLWTLRSGDAYDASYPRRFVAQALKQVMTTGDWSTDIQETRNQKDKTLDVTLHFDRKP